MSKYNILITPNCFEEKYSQNRVKFCHGHVLSRYILIKEMTHCTGKIVTVAALVQLVILSIPAVAFDPSRLSISKLRIKKLFQSNTNDEEAQRLQQKAIQLRDQIREMESQLGESRKRGIKKDSDSECIEDGKTLKNKRVLIVGANGRLGSMVTRCLLRSHPEVKEVVAAVHYVGQATTRGWGRLSYEVGAEDGIGSIGPAWSSEDERNASFIFDPETMSGYNLDKLRIVEVELLDPVQVRTITEGVDAVIFAATDFDGNRPRAIASLNAAFLFRAVASPAKGRVEVEGVRNVLEGFMGNLNNKRYKERLQATPGNTSVAIASEPTQFVHVSTCPGAFGEFETPFGEFNGLKRQGEYLVMESTSISSTVIQLGKFDDNFVEEGQELKYADATDDTEVCGGVINARQVENKEGTQKRINRRDAARAAVEALLDERIEGKKVQVYTAVRKTDIW